MQAAPALACARGQGSCLASTPRVLEQEGKGATWPQPRACLRKKARELLGPNPARAYTRGRGNYSASGLDRKAALCGGA